MARRSSSDKARKHGPSRQRAAGAADLAEQSGDVAVDQERQPGTSVAMSGLAIAAGFDQRARRTFPV